ncbi:hypothetical protein K443DRAFT_124130 [Laccaria amethystina LaAM-08-1]|uniref:Uncharacterized protein n=1 Tax=Laccaria amethystina LaAM-08-1 TaxID=1095629 RepID=A0A0C9XMJ9_9AGAR|nr:hypothetical protein K443DRAFT_124130 [Laccaria amethystina LaAM-08-1]
MCIVIPRKTVTPSKQVLGPCTKDGFLEGFKGDVDPKIDQKKSPSSVEPPGFFILRCVCFHKAYPSLVIDHIVIPRKTATPSKQLLSVNDYQNTSKMGGSLKATSCNRLRE